MMDSGFVTASTVETSRELAGSSDTARPEARGTLDEMLSSPLLAEMPDSSVSAIDIAGERTNRLIADLH